MRASSSITSCNGNNKIIRNSSPSLLLLISKIHHLFIVLRMQVFLFCSDMVEFTSFVSVMKKRIWLTGYVIFSNIYITSYYFCIYFFNHSFVIVSNLRKCLKAYCINLTVRCAFCINCV